VVGAGGALAPMATPTVASGDSPNAIAVSPNGDYVYVANNDTDGSGGVSQYTVGAGGALAPMAVPTVASGDGPESIAVSPNGQYVYVANNDTDGSGGVSQYTVGAGGALAPMATPTVGAGDEPLAVVVGPNGQYVYVANNDTDGSGGVSQYTVGAGGALAPMATPTVAAGDGPVGIAVTPDQGPAASFTASAAAAGSASSFNASGSSSSDSTVATYEWSFGDGATSVTAGPTATHVYARPGTYTVQLAVVDANGCSTATVFTGQTAYCNGNAAATTTQTVLVPAPTISGLSVPRKVSAAGRKVHGRCVKPRKKNKAGKACQLSIKLKATYTLNAAVAVSFQLSRKATGRKVSGKCRNPTRKNRHRAKCTLLVSVQKTVTRSGVVGSNSFSFTGKLAAGTYQLTATPAGGTSKTVTFRLTG